MASLEQRGYNICEQIGKGAFSVVCKATYSHETFGQKILACKCIDKETTSEIYNKKFLPRELEALRILTHPNIIHIHSILENDKRVYIFMRLAEKGSLLGYIRRKHITEVRAKFWFFQIVSAVEYIHSMNFAHRDLKCDNILVTSHLNVKITDFTMVRKCGDQFSDNFYSETCCGSKPHSAPEVLSLIPYDAKKSDCWALGIVLYSMLHKSAYPFDATNTQKMIENMENREYKVNNQLTYGCVTTISVLLQPNPNLRPDASEVCKLDWLYPYNASMKLGTLS